MARKAVAGPIDLPELRYLRLLALLPGQEPPARTVPRGGNYLPDGTPLADWESLVDLVQSGQVTADDLDIGVARTVFYRAGVRLKVSTVFLVHDHALSDDLPPVLWETMIFHGEQGWPGERWRYCSREAALAGHRTVCAALRAGQQARREVLWRPRRHLSHPYLLSQWRRGVRDCVCGLC